MTKRLDEMFPMETSHLGHSRCLAMISWDVVCQSIKGGGLGILHMQSINTALLTKWVTRIMGPEEDLAALILRDNYNMGLDWVTRFATNRGASPFCQGL